MKKQRSLQVPLFPFPMLALLLGTLSGCASTRVARSDWQARIPRDCNVDEIQFARHGGPRLPVLHVSGLEPAAAAKLSGGVREALLGSIAEKRQSRIWRKARRSPFKRVVDFPPVPWLTRLPEDQGDAPAMKTAGGAIGPGPFNPGNEPVPFYIGKEVHKAIGAQGDRYLLPGGPPD